MGRSKVGPKKHKQGYAQGVKVCLTCRHLMPPVSYAVRNKCGIGMFTVDDDSCCDLWS